MRWRFTVLLLAATVLLSAVAWAQNGISTAFAKAQQTVRAQLYDPESAVFRDVNLSPRGDVCGQVDSRNVEGGRTGYARFVFDHQTSKAALSLHDPDFRQFFVMNDNEYTNGNAAVITNDACAFVRTWSAICPADMARGETHAKALCALYDGGSKSRARLKKIVGAE